MRKFAFAALLFLAPCTAQQPPTVPTQANIAYAPAEPTASKGHLLDLYLPASASGPVPVVIWTGGSAWFGDDGKASAARWAQMLTSAGYAVAGVSIRSSSQVKFPGQLHDIKAAIRYLRANAGQYGLDADHIAIMGDSSGGWTSAMAALTGDVPDLEGAVGTTGVSSAVQAAIAFYPPSRFADMDRWGLRACETAGPDATRDCHDDAGSPESQLIGCPIQECADKAALADPARYVSANDPPLMILHGETDSDVPHQQGEWLYQALNKACRDAVFISLPLAKHGQAHAFLTDPAVSDGATIRSTAAAGCAVKTPELYRPSMATLIDFLDTHLKPEKTAP